MLGPRYPNIIIAYKHVHRPPEANNSTQYRYVLAGNCPIP